MMPHVFAFRRVVRVCSWHSLFVRMGSYLAALCLIFMGACPVAAQGLRSVAKPAELEAVPRAFVPSAAATSEGGTDPLLQAMQAELTREKAQLVLPGMRAPYFIEYRLEDIHSFDAVASYGALTSEVGKSAARGAGGGTCRGLRDRFQLRAREWFTGFGAWR